MLQAYWILYKFITPHEKKTWTISSILKMLHKNIFHKYCIDWLANIGHIPKNEFIFCSFYSFAENSELLAFSLFPSALNKYLKKKEREERMESPG